jgi:uncharacterized protein (TIGR01777 family)
VKIAVTGSSGLIGTALVAALRADGAEVRRLVRRAAAAPDEVRWQPGLPDPAAVDGCDAVVHLGGVGIGDRRWSAARKAEILRSRVDGTLSLARSIAAAPQRPRVLLSASAIGWYGDTGEDTVEESAPQGDGFLADVVRQWEQATQPAVDAGTRVVRLRSGIVLSPAGGALGRVLPLFRLGLGARLGSGQQWTSWIALPDHVAAARFLLEAEVEGPVNLVAPEPVRNADYTQAVAAAVHRPAVLSVPAAALRAALDGLADEALLIGQRVRPRVLQAAGFRWAHPRLPAALEALL